MHRLIRRAILAAPVLLAACLGAGQGTGTFRDTGTPIWSAAALDPVSLAGDWQQVAGFASQTGGCRTGTLSIGPEAGGLKLSGSLCLNGKPERLRGRADLTGPGRLTVSGEEWWILWVDSGYRTLVIGAPSGRFGLVLDRGAIPPDRLQAARDVLDFNGYDLSLLRPF